MAANELSAGTRPNHPMGRVDLVGAGPGDPGLITVNGRKALETADVVVYDQLVSPRLLDYAPATAERIFAGKHAGRASISQDQLNALLVELARKGRHVVRLKGGDPWVFARGAEEAAYLRAHGVPFRIVPGVTAGVGVPAYAGLPITLRGTASAVAFVTGHDDPESNDCSVDWPALARFPGTLVIYMGRAHFQAICRVLARNGLRADTPALAISRGTTASQSYLAGTLSDLAERIEAAKIEPPTLFVLGEIVERRPALSWFEALPLFGQRIVVTRPHADALDAAEQLESMGAEVLIAPMVCIEPIGDYTRVDRAIAEIARWDWLVFTSRNGVIAFLDRLMKTGGDLRALGGARIAAIGPGTQAALGARGLRADVVPSEFRSEGLIDSLAPIVAGKRVLLARADRGRVVLQEELAKVADVEQIAVYRNVDAESLPEHVARRLREGTVDWVTLTSSAIAERFAALIPAEAKSLIGARIRIASLSPVTSEAVARIGWPVGVEAREYTWQGLVAALVEACGGSTHEGDPR